MPLAKPVVDEILTDDLNGLLAAEKDYGDSWKKRGGTDSFFMLARKWDRIEHQVKRYSWNILEAVRCDTRPNGIRDDIRDLRRYLILVEHQIALEEKGVVIAEADGGDATKDYVGQ